MINIPHTLEDQENAIRQSKREWAYRNKHKRPTRDYEREKELKDIRKFSGYYEIVIDGVKSIGFSKNISARCSALLRRGHKAPKVEAKHVVGDYKILFFSNTKDEAILQELRDKL